MATITQFEELKIWQEARALSKSIYDLTKTSKDFDFNNQIRRAAVSVMNNIAEGFDRGSNKDFVRFLHIAKASCSEVRSMLYLGEDLQMFSHENTEVLRKFCFNLSSAIKKFINYLENHNN